MRVPCLLLAFWLALGVAGRADEQPVQRFDGHNSLTTADFTVPDGWEIRWRSDQVLSLGVIRRDNTVVAGMTGRSVGSLYLPQGGSFRIRVKGEDPIPWDVAVYALDKTAPSGDEAAADYYAPTPGPAFQPLAAVPDTNTPPAAPIVPVAPVPPPIPTELTDAQMQCVVTIKGDRTQGTGFFVKLGGRNVVVTTQQLIANNPNWQVFASNGNKVQVTTIEGATDRDVALIGVKDFGYSVLPPGDPGALRAGDAVLIGSADGTLLPPAAVAALGPQRIEIDELHAPPGSPVVLARTGQVVGVVAVAPELTALDHFTEQNFHERDTAVKHSRTTFGLRFDNLPGRDAYDLLKLQAQTQFLDAFHQRSRALDAYLNGSGSTADTHLWQSDDKIRVANANFLQNAAGGDSDERIDALHGLLFELGLEADADLSQAQRSSNFYGFLALRAKDETAYRQALKSQLEGYNANVSNLNGVVTRNN